MPRERLALFGGPRAVPEAPHPWPEIRQADKDAVMRVLDSGRLSGWGVKAREARALEEEWAGWVGRRFCLATNSGTAALHMALAAVGVGPGDEVITTPFSFTATATCILYHNAIPVFVDIDPETYNIDPARIEEKITTRTKAILPVHLYGLAADMDPILEIAARHSLAVVEDCCQAHGARYKGRKVGTLGHAAAFSINSSKLLAAGEGGLLVTNDEQIFAEAARVQQFGERRVSSGAREYDAHSVGWMYRTTEMTAGLARSQLSRLDDTIAAVRENAEYLASGLKGMQGLVTPTEPAGYVHVYYGYNLRFTPERLGIDMAPAEFVRRVRAALHAEGLALGCYEFLIPGMTLFQQRRGYGRGCPWTCGHHTDNVEYRVADYPVARATIERILAPGGLTPPNGRELMERYVEAVHKVFDDLDAVLST
jgi:dTDP-4-amino-4,6-dideoxygalactose transaminase